MQVDDIRVFIPSKDFQQSEAFYQAIGFRKTEISDDLSLFECGECSFFLQRFYDSGLANNLMLQVSVLDINEAYKNISNLTGFNIKYEPVKTESWGKVFYLWGPAGELWHITEFV